MINKLIVGILPHMPKRLVWVFSQRYIAGETLEAGLKASAELNKSGILVTVDLLGEFITNIGEAHENKLQYMEIITRFTKEHIRGNFSIKPTMFGLLIDKETCYSYVREIVKLAAGKNSFIRIDMEDSQCVDMEIDLYLRLKEEFPMNVGLVLQAYLRRTPADLERMLAYHSPGSPLNFRLCKGIYIEPREIAWKGYQEVRDQFLNILEIMFQHNIYAGIATHDKYLVEGSLELIKKYSVPPEMVEFQMLSGQPVTPQVVTFAHTDQACW